MDQHLELLDHLDELFELDLPPSSLTLWVLCRTTERPLLPGPISSMSLLARLVFEMPGMSMAVSFIGGIEELTLSIIVGDEEARAPCSR